MSTAIAVNPATALTSAPVERQMSPRQFTFIAPSAAPSSNGPPSSAAGEPANKRARSNGSPDGVVLVERAGSNGKSSPHSNARNAPPPAIKVKKEPGSPPLASSRPRPKRLDLSSNNRTPQNTGRPSAPLTARESAGLGVQDVGLACLSPGFQTNDPSMREQLQRSLDVREQQRMIIEARNRGSKPGTSHEQADGSRGQDNSLFGASADGRTPTTSRRKGPPPGLSITAPSASQFANDRVVQSAPLHQTFTGLRPGEYAHTRHVQHGPSGLSQTSHIHHVPATQTNNRLPPISDVFAHDRLDAPRAAYPSAPSPSQPNHHVPPVPSPGFGPPPTSARTREFRSAEEAVHGLSGGRDELMPKVLHYGGVQPPTPPSPMPTGSGAQQHQHHSSSSHYHHPQPPHPSQSAMSSATHPAGRPDILVRTSSGNGRRRGRDEYERDNGSPPFAPPPPSFSQSSHQHPHQHSSAHQPMGFRAEHKRPMIAVRGDDDDWKAGMSGAEKKEEFLRLCERAWDLFHS